MRIITRDLHKAFPELDRFSDTRAKAFVKAAQSSWSVLAVRWSLVFLTALVIAAGSLFAALWLLNEVIRPSRYLDGPVMGLLLFAALAITALAAMMTRDYLLRRRIRRLISRRGTCPQCSYSLLGMPVGPDLMVTCPECGVQAQADPAMNELAPPTTEGGRPTFAPSGVVESPAVTAARKRRRKAIIKWTLITLASLIAAAGITFGLWRAWLWSMTRQARADRNLTALATAHVQSAHSAQDLQQSNQWPALVKVLQAWRDDNESMVADAYDRLADSLLQTNPLGADARNYFFGDFEALYSTPAFDPTTDDALGSESPLWVDRRRVLARALLKHAADKGHLAAFKFIQTVQHAARDIPTQPDTPGSQTKVPELGYCRYFTRMNAARMEVALEAGDRTEYLAALDQTLALARILDKQVTVIDRLVASAIDGLILGRVRAHADRYPDDPWRSAVATAVYTRRRTTPLEHTLTGDRLITRDTVAWYFSDLRRVELAMIFGDTWQGQAIGGLPAIEFDRLGSYSENLAKTEARTQQAIADSKLPRPQRSTAAALAPAPTPARSSILADAVSDVSRHIFNSEDIIVANARTTLIMLALESTRARTGTYPASLAALVAADPTLIITDPCSGKPFGYRLLTPTPGSPDQRGYLLWSTGFDSIDDQGQDVLNGRGYNWTVTNTDVILNPPKP